MASWRVLQDTLSQMELAAMVLARVHPILLPMAWFTPCMSSNLLIVTNSVSQSVDLGRSNNPNTTPTKDYEIVRVVVYLHGVQRGCAEEGERGSTPTG